MNLCIYLFVSLFLYIYLFNFNFIILYYFFYQNLLNPSHNHLAKERERDTDIWHDLHYKFITKQTQIHTRVDDVIEDDNGDDAIDIR